MDRLKKCYASDPETNLGIPVELTAADVRPYFESQDLLGRIPSSEFAPHVFDNEQELPLFIPSDQPRDETPTAPIGPLDGPPLPDRTTATEGRVTPGQLRTLHPLTWMFLTNP